VYADTKGNNLSITSGGADNGHQFISFSRDVFNDAPTDTQYGMKSMRSVFGRVPARYTASIPLRDAAASSPEAFLYDDNGATLMYNAAANGGGGGIHLGNTVDANPSDWGTINVDGNVTTLIDKWSILFTGDTAPAAYKTAVYDYITGGGRFPRSTDANKKEALKNLLAALLLSPYGLVRT